MSKFLFPTASFILEEYLVELEKKQERFPGAVAKRLEEHKKEEILPALKMIRGAGY